MKRETISTPIGDATLFWDEGQLLRLEFQNDLRPSRRATLSPMAQEVRRYFEGSLREFSQLQLPKGTAFQEAVWRAVRQIPYGETRTYADIAKAIGRPRAVRAVGTANKINSLPLIIPCHRVIGRSGALTGYNGGIERKAWLLQHEGATLRAAI